MSYIIKLMGGGVVEITDEEFGKLQGKQGAIYIPSAGQIINLNSVSQILPKSDFLADKLEERKNQKEGILHDGTHVFRHFGQWYKLNGDYNQRGEPLTRFDPEMYPEVARDCVPTKQEYYGKYATLPMAERLKLIIAGTRDTERKGEIKVLAEILKDKGVTK